MILSPCHLGNITMDHCRKLILIPKFIAALYVCCQSCERQHSEVVMNSGIGVRLPMFKLQHLFLLHMRLGNYCILLNFSFHTPKMRKIIVYLPIVWIKWDNPHKRVLPVPKVIYRSNAIPIKTPRSAKIYFFFCRNRKKHFKIHMEFWGHQKAKTIFEKEQQSCLLFEKQQRKLTLPDFKT